MTPQKTTSYFSDFVYLFVCVFVGVALPLFHYLLVLLFPTRLNEDNLYYGPLRGL